MTDEQKISELKKLRGQIAGRQQNQASDPSLSVWVEASAGTGKTKVLSDRVLRLFLDGVHPSQILCLTYTKAAAVEMNDRISARLAQWAVIDESKLCLQLQELTGKVCDDKMINRARTLFALTLDVPGGLKIQTIHSFCQEILKRFPLEAGIPPYFEIMDERTSREILSAVSKELVLKIERETETPLAKAIAFLTCHVREFKFAELMNTLAENRAKISTVLAKYADFDSFLTALQNNLSLEKIQTDQEAVAEFVLTIDRQKLRELSAVLAQSSKTDQQNAEVLCLLSRQSEKAFDYEAYKKIFLTGNKIRETLARRDALKIMPEIGDVMYELAEQILELEKRRQKLRLFESTRALMTVAGALAEGYNAYKQKNARLDYEDLITLTRRLLENRSVADWILFKLDAAINHILIDEAQDTSPDQWAIIRALSDDFFSGSDDDAKPRTLFAVGDRKQSIYSFQGANPDEFDNMHRYFARKAANFTKVRLDVSFRSTEAVLQSVNNLFAMEEAQKGVVIDGEKVEHLPYRIGQSGKVEIWPLVEVEKDDTPDIWYPPLERRQKPTASALLAQNVARRIKNLVTGNNRLESQNRPICYGDIMVLVQRRNAFVDEFVRECKNIGVAITGVDKLKLHEQIAVEDLLSLAKFLLLPEDDLSLAEVLKSPLFGLGDDDLFKLCYKRKSTLWQSLKEAQPYTECAKILSTLLDKVDYVRPYELFNHVLGTLHGRRQFAARLGAEAEDALDEFMNLTLDFEREHIPDLQTFVQWIEADKSEVKRELEQSDVDAVRLMTVHGSKGLQAPIVILPDTTRVVYMLKSSKLLNDEDNMLYYPLGSEAYEENCDRIYDREKEKAFEEYRRLLYVALTRAEDRLYICGLKPGKGEDKRSWYHLCRQMLETYGTAEETGEISLSSPQIFQPQPKETKNKLENRSAMPEWIDQPAAEETPLAKPYRPSHDMEDDTAADSPLAESGSYFRRGLIIHRLLQLLTTGADKANLQKFIRAFLHANAPEMNDSQKLQIEKEILKLYENDAFSFIFGPQSYAEVPVAGEIDGRIVSAQIDRLYIGDDKIIIVDFKTNRPAAETVSDVAPLYLKQLTAYKKLIEKIYPQKPVETYILWTNNANLMKIN